MAVIAAIILLFVSSRISAEPLRMPPVSTAPVFTKEHVFLSGVTGWFEFRQNFPIEENSNHGKVHDVGIILTLYSGPLFSVSFISREIFQNRIHPESILLWYPLSLFSTEKLEISFNAGGFEFSAGFNHDCKHDIDWSSGRNAIHEFIYLRAEYSNLEWHTGLPGWSTRLYPAVEIGENITPLFQFAETEPDLYRISASVRVEPLFHSLYGGPFIHGRFSLIGRTPESRVSINSEYNMDYLFRAGYQLRGKKGGLSLYYQVEHITDDVITLTPVPVTIQAVSVLFEISG